MNHLIVDLIQYICEFLNTKSKMNLLMMNKYFYALPIQCHESIHVLHIKKHTRFVHFTYLRAQHFHATWHHLLKLELTMRKGIIHAWPSNLKTLIIPYNKSPFIVFPERLTHLELGMYNQPFTIPWPSTLQVLHMDNYNCKFNYAWPSTLIHLSLVHYNQTFDYAWPATLKTIMLYHYNQPLRWSWPESLGRLICHVVDPMINL